MLQLKKTKQLKIKKNLLKELTEIAFYAENIETLLPITFLGRYNRKFSKISFTLS